MVLYSDSNRGVLSLIIVVFHIKRCNIVWVTTRLHNCETNYYLYCLIEGLFITFMRSSSTLSNLNVSVTSTVTFEAFNACIKEVDSVWKCKLKCFTASKLEIVSFICKQALFDCQFNNIFNAMLTYHCRIFMILLWGFYVVLVCSM